MINGSDMPITAGGTGAIEIDIFGNHVAELASSQNSHGGGRRRIIVGFRRGCFSCGILTHTTDQCQSLDKSLPFCLRDGRRVTSGTSSFWDRGLKRGPQASRWETPTDPGRGVGHPISDDYRPQLPVVGEDIPGPAVPCHVGTARELEMVNQRTRMVGCAVRRPYSDSDDSDNDVLHAEEHDSAVRQVSLRNEWLVDSRRRTTHVVRGVLPADDRVGDLPAPESEVDVSDSESEADYIESDSAPLQMATTAVKLLCPPVVIQTRPMEGCDLASPRRLRRGRDVLTEDSTVAVDTRQVSTASDAVDVSGIHIMPECFPTVTPKLAAEPAGRL